MNQINYHILYYLLNAIYYINLFLSFQILVILNYVNHLKLHFLKFLHSKFIFSKIQYFLKVQELILIYLIHFLLHYLFQYKYLINIPQNLKLQLNIPLTYNFYLQNQMINIKQAIFYLSMQYLIFLLLIFLQHDDEFLKVIIIIPLI